MNLDELLKQEQEIRSAIKAANDKAGAEKRDLSADENKAIDAKLAELDGVIAKISELRKADADKRRAERIAEIAKGDSVAEQRKTEPSQPRVEPELRAHPEFRMAGTPSKGFDTREAAYKAGMWAAGAMFGNQRAAQWSNDYGYRVADARALNIGSNAAGAVLVPDEFSDAILWNREQHGVAARYAQSVPMASDFYVGPTSTGEVTIYAVSENPSADVTASEPTFGSMEIIAKTWGVNVPFSNNLAQDAVIGIANYIAEKIGWAWAKKEDQAVFIGDGTSTYHGLRGLTSGILGSASISTTSANDTYVELTATELLDVKAKLATWATDDLAWYCSPTAYALAMERLALAAGGNTAAQINGGVAGAQFMGYPVRFVNVMDATTGDASTKYGFLFGSLRQSVALGNRKEMALLSDPFTLAGRNQTRILGFARWGMNVHDIGDASNKGAMAALVFAS